MLVPSCGGHCPTKGGTCFPEPCKLYAERKAREVDFKHDLPQLVHPFPIPDLRERIAALKWAVDLTREASGGQESDILDTMLVELKVAFSNSLTEDEARKLIDRHK